MVNFGKIPLFGAFLVPHWKAHIGPKCRFWLFGQIHTGKKISERFADFLYKTAFLKSKFKDDPVRVQRHTVSHFKGLE